MQTLGQARCKISKVVILSLKYWCGKRLVKGFRNAQNILCCFCCPIKLEFFSGFDAGTKDSFVTGVSLNLGKSRLS